MSALLRIALIATALLGAPVGYIFYHADLSPNNWVYAGGDPSNWRNAGIHGAPGPIVGAGLPLLALIAGGAYWLRRRSRTKAD